MSSTQIFSRYPLKTVEGLSFLFASLLGVLFHFVYDWSDKNFFAGLFFPVNESTWEHLKLVFLPILIVSVLEYFIGGIQRQDFPCIKLRSVLLGMLIIIALFYTYSGVLGTTIDWLNIVIYFIGMGVAYLYSYRRLNAESPSNCSPHLNLFLTFFLLILFMVFTVYPPSLGLFSAPL